MDRGQHIRLLLRRVNGGENISVIGAAKQMSLHGSAQTEESTTKDTMDTVTEYEVTETSYEITGSGLMLTIDDSLLTDVDDGFFATDVMGISDQIYEWQIAKTSGPSNRDVDEVIFSGQCKITSLQIDAPNRQYVTYSYTLKGYGPIVIGEEETTTTEESTTT